MNNNDILHIKEPGKFLSEFTYIDYFYRFMLLARSMFKWENLPNGLKEEWVERYLFNEGRCMFFYDSDLGYMIAKVADCGEVNVFDEPIKLLPIATNYGKSKHYINGVDGVLIKNNDCSLPTSTTIALYSLRIAEITREIDINVNEQKTPLALKGNSKQIATLKRMYDQYEGNRPALFIDKGFDGAIESIDTQAPVVFDKLQIQKHELINECMTFLGLNNANTQKRERLITDEVEANNEEIAMNAQIMLKARQQAVEEINKIFNLNIKVSLRHDVIEDAKSVEGGEVL